MTSDYRAGSTCKKCPDGEQVGSKLEEVFVTLDECANPPALSKTVSVLDLLSFWNGQMADSPFQNNNKSWPDTVLEKAGGMAHLCSVLYHSGTGFSDQIECWAVEMTGNHDHTLQTSDF